VHRLCDALTLIEHRTQETSFIRCMRIPMAIQGAESSRREGFVDWRVLLDPGEALGEPRGVCCELRRKARIEQVGMRWSAAMMDETNDRLYR